MANSRNKGNKNERKAAALISKWTKKKFERTPSSGGLQWKASFSKGDIVCTVEGHVFPFCVEVKAHKGINFSELLIPEKKGVKILEFWAQSSRDAKLCNKIPLLMMRYDRLPADLFFLAIPTDFFKKLPNSEYLPMVMQFYNEDVDITILPSSSFFTLNYKETKLIAKTYINETKR